MYSKLILATTLVACICPLSSADILVNQDQNYYTSNLQSSLYRPLVIDQFFSLPEIDNRMADDFVLPQPGTITGVNVRGVISDNLGPGIPAGWIVKFYANNGQAGVDASYPGTAVFTQNVSNAQVTTGANGLVQFDLSATPFNAAAGTKYWVGVQAVRPSSPGSDLGWRWAWNNDPSGPPASGSYVPSGSAAAKFDTATTSAWDTHWKRVISPGQFPGFDPDVWALSGYSGELSGNGAERLDLNFQLIGTFAAVPEPSSLVLGSMGLVALVAAARRRSMAR